MQMGIDTDREKYMHVSMHPPFSWNNRDGGGKKERKEKKILNLGGDEKRRRSNWWKCAKVWNQLSIINFILSSSTEFWKQVISMSLRLTMGIQLSLCTHAHQQTKAQHVGSYNRLLSSTEENARTSCGHCSRKNCYKFQKSCSTCFFGLIILAYKTISLYFE